MEARGLNRKTVDAALRHIWQFNDICGQTDFREIGIELITRYKTKLQSPDQEDMTLSASTIVHAFANLRGFFEWLPRQHGYGKVPLDLHEYFTAPRSLVQIANAPTQKSYPTHEEVVAVVEAMPTDTFLNRRDRAIIAFVYLTGVRVGALITLALKHVDVEQRLVNQAPSDSVATKNSKTIRSDWFPVGKNFDEIVINWLTEMTSLGAGPDAPLFPRGPKYSFGEMQPQEWEFLASDDAVVRIMASAAAAVGVDRFTPHRLRDTLASNIDRWATTLEEQKACSQSLGHESMRTTFERYGPVSEARQHQLMANMSKRGPATFDYDVLHALANAPEYKRRTIRDLLLGK